MPANKMNSLLDKIERRLGTRPLNLPEHLQKDKWAKKVIENETLDTFSRFFPNALKIKLSLSQQNKDGYYVLDEYLPTGVEVIGVRDIDWTEFSDNAINFQQANGYGMYNMMIENYSIPDVALLQMRADTMSLFNNQIFVEYKEPNLVKISNVSGANLARGIREVPIVVFIKHAPNLMTISPTMMETFEALAQADVASFLYEELKYFDGLETVYANIDLKMNDLQEKASHRADIVNEMKESYVSAANDHQPLIFTI